MNTAEKAAATAACEQITKLCEIAAQFVSHGKDNDRLYEAEQVRDELLALLVDDEFTNLPEYECNRCSTFFEVEVGLLRLCPVCGYDNGRQEKDDA